MQTIRRTVLAVVAVLGLLLVPFGTASAAPGTAAPAGVDSAILTDASITFNTLDDDKDGDTLLRIEVLDAQGRVVAVTGGNFGLFRDQTQNGPFPLRIRAGVTEASLVGGTLHIGIIPNGNDTWRFSAELDLGFDVDFQFTIVDPTELNQGHRDLRVPLQIF